MNTSALRAAGPGAIGSRLLWFAVLAIGVFFIVRYVPRYLLLSPDSYGPYFWPRAGYLLPHVLGGLVALVIGPFQFWSRLRNRHPKVHRVSGRVYLGAVLVGALGGFAMALTIPESLAYATGLFFLSVAWTLTAGMAFVAIRRREVEQHKEWMIRSYVVTFAIVSFRIVDDLLNYFAISTDAEQGAMLAWACWAVPLLFAEAILQARRIFRQA